MKKYIKLGFMLISCFLIVASYSIYFHKEDILAKEYECDFDFPDDKVDPGEKLPKYLSIPKISGISNTNKGITIQWKAVKNAHGYRIQRRTENGKWEDLKTLKNTKYTDTSVKNGQSYTYKIYAYAANTIDYVESTGTDSQSQKFMHLKSPEINTIKKSKNKISWAKNKKADGYKFQIATSKKFQSKTLKKTSKSKNISTCVNNLKKNKSYYIRIRAYKTNGKNTYYSAWSPIKTFKK